MNEDNVNLEGLPTSALHESAEELYEMAPCGYLTTTTDGRIIKANRTLAEWLGYTPAELTDGKRFKDLLTVGGRIFFETHFNLLLRVQDSVDEIALDIVRKDGRILPALINARQKREASGEPVVNRFTVFNSSERRMYERQLLAARDLLQVTLCSIGDGVVATDAERLVTFMNPVAETLSGWKEEEARGKQIDEVLVLRREDRATKVENPIGQALATGTIVGLANHTVLLSKNGTAIPIDDSASPIRDASDAVIGAVLVFRDISERRAAERELQEVHKQLEINALELRRSNEDLSQFVHVASHDLRSPLNTVLVYAELLQRKYATRLEDGQELLQHLSDAAKRMGRLIEDLLAYARISAAAPPATELADANIALAAAIENLRSSIHATGAEIMHDALPAVLIPPTPLGQVFQNLIGNAIHYRSAETPRIHISVSDEGEHWLFSCKDNGIGIAPEYQTQIFEPFKRLHGVDRPGSGIGLAVCQRVVTRFQGRIWVESQPDNGSTFYFTLPKSGQAAS